MTLLVFTLLAQQTVAPTPDAVGPRGGTNLGGYNIRQSFETGYRFAAIDGNRGKYRSDVNFLNGVRLLGTSLTVHSRNGQGRYFDEIVLNTQGLGNDPYQFTSLRAEKNRLYRYEMSWRLNDFFNPGLTIAYGQHLQNLQRRMQDHQFTLLPQGRFQLFAGYSRNIQDGPALSTANLFDARGNIFPFFENVRRLQNEYRIGGLLQLGSLRLLWQRGWERFREDTRGSLNQPGTPLDPLSSTTSLDSFRRDQPYQGSTPHWRVNLFTERSTRYSLNGRFTHSAGRRNFLFDELATGAVRSDARNLQTIVFGDARRPLTSAHLTASLFATDRITLTNHTGFHHTRMEGDNTLRQLTNGSLDFTFLNFQFLGVRAFTNSTLLDTAVRPWLSLQGGYQYSQRRIRSTEQLAEGDFFNRAQHEQSNRLHAGTAGFRLRPLKGLTLVADGEIGRQNRPFYTTSERDYHAFGARAEYKQKLYRLAAQARTNINFNSVNLFRHSSRTRTYTFDSTFTPNARFALDLGYQRLHLDTLTSLAYFLDFRRIDGDSSRYLSQINAAHAGLRFSFWRKLDLYTGFSSTIDTAPLPSSLTAQSFPLSFVSPQFRASYRWSEKWRANFGYQYYDYAERQLAWQDYRAHTGYLSVLWSF